MVDMGVIGGRCGWIGLATAESVPDRSTSNGWLVMATKGKDKGFGGVPASVFVIVAHVIADLISNASCPQCGDRVVLYVCVNCKKVVRPRRGRATS